MKREDREEDPKPQKERPLVFHFKIGRRASFRVQGFHIFVFAGIAKIIVYLEFNILKGHKIPTYGYRVSYRYIYVFFYDHRYYKPLHCIVFIQDLSEK